jgi:ATP-dependent RNA helicase DDX56/DBP9
VSMSLQAHLPSRGMSSKTLSSDIRKLMSRSLQGEAPDVIISTPTKLLALLENKSVDLSHLCFLAVDEADLLLSYGHKDDLTRLMDPASGWMPKLGVQGCLMSATLSEDVEGVKGLVLRNPVSPAHILCPHARY